jgi:hypothetical protein
LQPTRSSPAADGRARARVDRQRIAWSASASPITISDPAPFVTLSFSRSISPRGSGSRGVNHLHGGGEAASTIRLACVRARAREQRTRPPREARELICDIHDKTRNLLVEAKGTGARGEVRMAIGQLLDYRRFFDPQPSCALLLPERPRRDLEDLLASAGISVIWKTDSGFEANADGRFA